MSKGYKKATVLGWAARDPEMRFLQDGTAVASFSLPVDNYARSGEEATTTWFSVSAFGKTAEVVQKFVVKGSQVLVVGEITLRMYKDKNGVERASLDLRAQDVQLTGKKGDNGAPAAATPITTDNSDLFADENLPF